MKKVNNSRYTNIDMLIGRVRVCQYMVAEFSGGVYMVQYIYMLIGRERVCQYYMVAEFSGVSTTLHGTVYLHVDRQSARVSILYGG